VGVGVAVGTGVCCGISTGSSCTGADWQALSGSANAQQSDKAAVVLYKNRLIFLIARRLYQCYFIAVNSAGQRICQSFINILYDGIF